jgi:hypothetical protein
MYTDAGPAISFRTWRWLLPQKVHFSSSLVSLNVMEKPYIGIETFCGRLS